MQSMSSLSQAWCLRCFKELTHMSMKTAPHGALQTLIEYQGLRCFHSTSRGRNPWTRPSALRCTEVSPIADLGLDWGFPVGAIVACIYAANRTGGPMLHRVLCVSI